MLSKKYYIMIATVLNKYNHTWKLGTLETNITVEEKAIKEVISHITHELIEVFEKDNPLFNKKRFIDTVNK